MASTAGWPGIALASDGGSKEAARGFQGQVEMDPAHPRDARPAALDKALCEALVGLAPELLDPALQLEGQTLIQDAIFSHPEEYIASYRVGTEGPDPRAPTLYTVEVTGVHLKTAELKARADSIRAVVAQTRHPTVATVIREDIARSRGKARDSRFLDWTHGAVRDALAKRLVPLGWTLVSAEELDHKIHPTEAAANPNALPGRDFSVTGADYVVVGSITITPEERPHWRKPDGGTEVLPVDAVSLVGGFEVRSTGTGEPIAAVDASQTVSGAKGLDAAFEAAITHSSDALAKVLIAQVLEHWRSARLGTSLQLRVLTDDYATLQAVEDELKQQSFIAKLEEESFDQGVAAITLSASGMGSRELAMKLGTANLPVKLRVTRVTADELEVAPKK